MRRYLQHGRRHASTGTDPIPGLGSSSIPYAHAALDAANTAVPVGNTEFPAGAGSRFYTNDSSVYQHAQNTDFPGIYGVQILTAGHYRIMFQASVNTFGAGAVDLAIALAEGPSTYSSYYGMTEVISSTKIYTDGGGIAVTLTLIAYAQVNGSSSGVPADPIVWFVNNSGANTAHLSGGSYDIEQIDSDSTFIS